MSKGGSRSSMTQTGGQSSFGGQMPMQQQGYQSPFGNQSYRSQPSQPTFNNYSYQQPGQFGGQMMNQSMRSPGSKGGYQPPMRQQIPSPGGKGRSYQPPPTPYGYGQSTFNPGQFGGYGQPSNIFSFSSPHYQPYVPPVYEPPPPPPPPPYRGDDPRGSGVTSSPPSIGSKGGTQRTMPDYSSSGVTGYQPSFGGKGGYYQSAGQLAQPINLPAVQPPPVMPSMPQTKIIDPRGAFTPPTQPPAPVNNQTLTPVMPKPTMPSREVPVFPSVGGIGGGQSFVGGFIPTGPEPRFRVLATNDMPRPIFSGMNAEQKEQEEKYRAAQAKKPRYFDNVTGKPVTQSEYDALGGNKQPTGGYSSLPLSNFSGGIGSLMGPSGLPGRSESFTPPIQNETAAKNFWSQAQKAMDSGSLADADRFLRQYESITGTRNPMYGLSALDPSGYQSAIANR